MCRMEKVSSKCRRLGNVTYKVGYLGNLEELQVGNGSSEAALGVQLPALEVQ